MLDNNEKSLLSFIQNNDTPSHRQAYSDRTAWLMACLSELVYEPFESIDSNRMMQFLEEKLENLLNQKNKETLSELLASIHKRDLNAIKGPMIELENFDIRIKNTYDHGDTQAFLVSTKEYLALVFRGTQSNSLKDIKTDLKAMKVDAPSKGGVHSGFSKAFDLVEAGIQNDLNKKEYEDTPLIIAGHSLGGALATVASRRLEHKGKIAACYTFGSPRVVDEEWSYDTRVPIYRVVNAIDGVTMLPLAGEIISVLKSIAGLFYIPGKVIQKILSYFEGYFHVGDMRYLTDCEPNNYDNVELTNAVSFSRRMRILARGGCASKFLKDHSVSVYRQKLAIIAMKRNKIV